jgi:uncharacterized cupin superfamily protein
MVKVIAYNTNPPKRPAVEPWPPIEGVQSGNPKQSAFTAYTSPDGSFITGLWTCTPGRYPVTIKMHETCHILSGRVVVTPKDGMPQEYGPSDVLVMPAGWEGTWDIRETIHKVFALSAKR